MKNIESKTKEMPRYILSKIPMGAEGEELMRLMKKYLNPRYKIVKKGGQMKDDADRNRCRFGVPLSLAKNFRVYIEDKAEKEGADNTVERFTDFENQFKFISYKHETMENIIEERVQEKLNDLGFGKAVANENAAKKIAELESTIDTLRDRLNSIIATAHEAKADAYLID